MPLTGEQTAVQKYEMDGTFEALLVWRLARSPELYSRLGFAVLPEALGSPSAQLIMKATHAVYTESKVPPASEVVVLQRIARMVADGKVAREDVEEMHRYINLVEDVKLAVRDDQLIAEAAPVVRRTSQHGLIKSMMEQYGRAQALDAGKLQAQLAQLDAIGAARAVRRRIGSIEDGLALEIDFSRSRLSTGNAELDRLISGGIVRPSLTIIGAKTHGGKSKLLSQIVAAGLVQGLNVAYGVNEGSLEHAFFAVTSALSNVALSAVNSDNRYRQFANGRMRELLANLGKIKMEEFDDNVPLSEYTAWLERDENELGRQFDLIVVDYMDRIGTEEQVKSDYYIGKVVAGGMRNWGTRRHAAVVTASQTRRQERFKPDRGKGGKKKEEVPLDVEIATGGVPDWVFDDQDLADSLHKSRIADYVITAQTSPQNPNNVGLLYASKVRFGVSNMLSNIIKPEFAFGRWTPWTPSLMPLYFDPIQVGQMLPAHVAPNVLVVR